jgi:hypothetical protein
MLQAKFVTLSRLLLDLGFTARTETGSFTRFDHASTGTWFLYPDYAPDEDVAASDLVGTRHILDAKGLLSRDEFEARLRDSLVAG